MRRSRRLIFPGLFVLSLVLLGGCSQSNTAEAEGEPGGRPAQPVEVTKVTRQDLTETLTVVGSLAANESAEVRPEISAVVRRILFEEGQEVEENDLLVQLDDRELQAQLREASVRLELARQTLERSQALLENRSISESDRDRALAEFERTRAEVDLLDVRLEKTQVRAPFGGRMGDRRISPGDFVTSSDVLSRVQDLSRLKVEFSLPDQQVPHVCDGTAIRVSVGGKRDEEFPGTVYFVNPAIDRSTRSVQVKGYVAEPDESLRPGMFVEVAVILSARENVLTVPETAILAREGQRFLVLVEEDEQGEVVSLQPVSLGLRQRGRVEVAPIGGGTLAEGQTVVAAGVGALPLFPGARVESRPLALAAGGAAAR